ncbi:MAG: DEAD/DEAH box helicase family protein [Desulfobacterales bacterium]|nr:DEAD/DEAH box helicase family protein [Desulfobacterales bacterium]
MKTFKSHPWNYTYKTSSLGMNGKPVDILHDFYIPALRLSIRYDRVVGYFRSTSLAAASQGFSAFTDSQGKMRLVVGADLMKEDTEAILKGDSQRLADKLNEQLGEPETWPVDVSRGVELLCWMVAHGYLEVRVAFRVFKHTTQPISFTSTEDGYVHEKWAIFTDEEGNRLYISGSLNESHTALVKNAENIDVHADWWSEIEKKRADEAEMSFENIWNDQSPYLKVMTLPEAVQQRLIHYGQQVSYPMEIDGTTGYQQSVHPPSSLERLKFALIKDGPLLPGGRYVGMETAAVKPWPHQYMVALRLIETWPYSYLLCDEVGLGKTIEAGLAIRSLYLSGLVKRVLIASPASLTRQWQREMASKFFLPFAKAMSGSLIKHDYVFPVEETRSAIGLYQPNLCIVSTGLMSRKERQHEIASCEPFDITLIDEAHYARRKNPKNGTRLQPQFGNLYKTISNALRSKTESLWLATATPMQMDWIEVFDLLTLTHRVGAFQHDPSLTWHYYENLSTLVRGENIHPQQWEFLRQAIVSLTYQDPFLKTYIDEAVIDSRIRNAVEQWLNRERIPKGNDKKHIQKLIFSAAPLSRVMLRHTRSLLTLYKEKGQLTENLAKREILPVPKIILKGIEKIAYNELESYCKELTMHISQNSSGNKNVLSLGFYLSFLRLRLASSLFAIKETLRRRKERVEYALAYLNTMDDEPDNIEDMESILTGDDDDNQDIIKKFIKNRTPQDLEWERGKLTEMIDALQDLSNMPSKMKELLFVLDKQKLTGGRIEQVVIFTRFYDTLKDIVFWLSSIDPSMLIGTYSGKGGQYRDPVSKKMIGVERDEIKHRFLRGEIDILVCTDAAAEGLNLQSANLLINYDLPWNPMKVEQRIGRIDRIGQKHDSVYVLNLCYVDSAEQIVYDRLLNRLSQTGYIVGTQQISMLPITIDEFNELASGQLSENELEKRAKERIQLQKQRTESMEISAKDLYETYIRLNNKKNQKTVPITLDAIWQALTESHYLRDLGCTVSSDSKNPKMILRGLPMMTRETELTADRILYERGHIHFASYSDPMFEAVVTELNQFELPPCIVRLTEAIADTHAEMAAYAVACISQNGVKEIKLITSWDELKGVCLDESVTLTEVELEPLRQQLHQLVQQEFYHAQTVKCVEKINIESALSQYLFALLSAKQLTYPTIASDRDNFWETISVLDEKIKTKERLIIPHLPLEYLNKLKQHLLVHLQLPEIGQHADITVPISFVASAVDLSCRIADGMKVKKSDLTIRMVQSRLDREIEKKIKEMRKEI